VFEVIGRRTTLAFIMLATIVSAALFTHGISSDVGEYTVGSVLVLFVVTLPIA
jgi:hypothetical protein